ncbi:unnamed protein product [Clonostachys rosea]|uniref:Carboxylic ester hydrolase n=1 Tax=Bionectria ochroleuca TaxID=29856 RepID=A0ABY6U7Z1_BIOOC|nr:unnamed protein product [Clonostachys rosea]
MKLLILLLLCLFKVVLCGPKALPRSPQQASSGATATAILPHATVLGKTADGVESFGGIPYAEAATGQLRLKPPKRLQRELGTFDATGPAAACPQFAGSPDSLSFLEKVLGSIANLPFTQHVSGETEDCLSITVARPAGTTSNDKLPVLFWIYGGAFELGWSSMYDGTGLVNHGVDLQKPFIFVAVNYRVAGFGFLAGKEILADGSANLGLLDQRMGLEWVADNIGAFGGDPDRVVIWGESAGAISVMDQMLLFDGDSSYNGKPLFRGAIMNSGSTLPAEAMDSGRAQAVYDQVVNKAGCTDSVDTLQCLRDLEYADFLAAVSTPPGLLSYGGLALSYLPRPDGTALRESPEIMLQKGHYRPIPIILGDQQDEGTLFALFQSNVTSKSDLVEYLKTIVFLLATEEQLTDIVDTYGDGLSSVVDGSPFGTGLLNEVFPGFKRRAALLGDVLFTLSRRGTLEVMEEAHSDIPLWTYLSTYDSGTPVLGTFHGSDILQVFFGIKDNYAAQSIRTYFINFLYNLNPNEGLNDQYPEWPMWNAGKTMMDFKADRTETMVDDFRNASYEAILRNVEVLKL